MRVFVLGGTGFIGSRLVERLVEERHEVVALGRNPQDLARFGRAVAVVPGDVGAPHTYRGRALDCQASVNCIGLLRESIFNRHQTYARVVVRGTQQWVKECQEAGVRHIILVSANGADPEGPPYARTKWMAEQAVRNSGLAWTILRPSFVIGPGGIVAEFARLSRLRVLPVFGRQDYFAEPVDRDDVVRVIAGSLKESKARNRVLHLGGPDQVTFRGMLKTIQKHAGIRCWTPRVPKAVGYALAGTLGWLPFFPATVENLRLLFRGNLVPERDFEKLFGLKATAFEPSVATAIAGLRTRTQ